MSVVVISTGGTIAATPNAESDAAPSLTGSDLVEAVPQLADLAEIEVKDFTNVPSPHLTIADYAALLERIKILHDRTEVDGIVITHGTDVLEETAYFLDCCYDAATPVVVTGSMRTPETPGADGPGNLLAAVRTAIHDESEGVLVCLNDRIEDPRTVTKAHTMSVDTFRSLEFGPLGTLDEDRVVWHRQRVRREPVFDPDSEQLRNDVAAVTVVADHPPSQIPTPDGVPALCLATTGAGHIPPAIIPSLEAFRDGEVPIVVTSRCPQGRLARSTYGFLGSEATLTALGCYFSDVNLQKTRIRTIVALAADGLAPAFDRPGREPSA